MLPEAWDVVTAWGALLGLPSVYETLLGAQIQRFGGVRTSDFFQCLGQVNLISSEGENYLERWNRSSSLLSHGPQGISCP